MMEKRRHGFFKQIFSHVGQTPGQDGDWGSRRYGTDHIPETGFYEPQDRGKTQWSRKDIQRSGSGKGQALAQPLPAGNVYETSRGILLKEDI